MKNSIIFVLFCLSLLIFGCGDGGKSEKTADNGNDSGRETGSLYGECYPNETCDKGLECDVENNICIKKPNENNNDQNDSENDNSDTMSYEDDDISDISSEQNDDTVDTKDDSDNSITDDSDSATETPCKPNPCVNVENSTGTCTPIDETRYSCWCKANYTWDSSTKTCKNDSNNNSDDKSPCKPNPCVNIENSTGTCTPIDETKYSCWCKANYTWNESSCIADSRTVDCTGLPANARWNTTSIITQTWNGTIWTPSATAIYSEEKSENECHFLCSSQDEWDGFQCKPQQEEKLVSLGNICSGLKDCSDNSKSLYPCPTISEDFFGQDANYANSGCIQHKFSIDSLFEEEKIIIDNNTFLEWQQTTSNLEYSFTEAINYCNNLIYAGYSDWRLPTPQELLSLSYEYLRPVQFFPNIYINLWSSKTYVLSNTDQAFYYYYGSIHLDSTTSTHNVMCVRGNEMQTAYFSTTDTNVLTDATTGLMWQRAFVSKSWQEALSYCETLDEGGYTDWRLPNKNELASLINYNKYGPASDHIYTPINHLWSSSTFGMDSAWTVNFFSGIVESKHKTELNNLHCVRSDICNEGYLWNGLECIGDCDENYFWNGSECIKNQCLPNNPCIDIANSTGICSTIDSSTFSCECKNGYYWNGTECMNPCESNPCVDLKNSSEVCTSTSWQNYFCECNSGYFWNGSSCEERTTLGNICTGQTSCYNASSSITCPILSSADFFGQDAQYTSKCAAQSFTSSANVIVDNNTKLTWEKSPSSSTYTWASVNNHCADLNSSNYGGKSNWRVPNPLELLTIVDNSKNNPATNSIFTNMPSYSYLWTSKEYKDNTIYAYYFSPSYGSYWCDGNSTKTNTYKVLCVSGDEMQPATSADFTTQTISGSVVVSDSKTGLMWQKEHVTGKTWQQALKYCEDSIYAGYSDWRLPNKNELASLVNYEKSGGPYSYFPNMPSNFFWSSSTRSGYTDYAWFVNFLGGGVDSNGKSGTYYVRCVRNAD